MKEKFIKLLIEFDKEFSKTNDITINLIRTNV